MTTIQDTQISSCCSINEDKKFAYQQTWKSSLRCWDQNRIGGPESEKPELGKSKQAKLSRKVNVIYALTSET
jgi:hypothetical protein